MLVFVTTVFISGEKGRLGIYSDSSGSPSELLGSTGEVEGSAAFGWRVSALDEPVEISSGTYYWLAMMFDSPAGTYEETTTDVGESNADTYSDGFADPFGSSTTNDQEMCIFATDELILGDAGIVDGGAVVEASDGMKYAVVKVATGVGVYKDLSLDGVASLKADDQGHVVHGAGNCAWMHAAIDSNDNIHIIATADADATRSVAYAIYDTGTDTLGTWEEAASYADAVPFYPGVVIALDSNDKPHVLYVDAVTSKGSLQDGIYYVEKTGASWSTKEQVSLRADKADRYCYPRISLCPNDDIEALYYFFTDSDVAYRRKNAEWGGESVYAESAAYLYSVTVTTEDTVYRYHYAGAVKENGVSTGYSSYMGQVRGWAALDGTDRYVFYVDDNDDVHVISNTGSGWVDEGVQQAGTYSRVIAEWAYNNENQSGEINYIFDDYKFVGYDSFSLPSTHPPLLPHRWRRDARQVLLRR
jgi:hypothetical protein